jgi:putative transposase
MPEYRRAFAPGGTFFFTLVTENRCPLFADERAREYLRLAILECQARRAFTLDAIVLLPDHLHALWTLPDGDANFSTRWAIIKKTFTQQWLRVGGREQATSDSRHRNRRRGVWQRRFWEHTIRDERDWVRHVDYIHYNPVKHGHATCPHAWPHSSFARWARDGYYAGDWQCCCESRAGSPPCFDDLKAFAME